MNYKLTIAYDGSRYDGWQRQGNTPNTIQGKIEAILSRLENSPVEIHGAGRTDAGVHAEAQVASVRLNCGLNPQEIKSYVNQYLPDDIAVTAAEEAPERFHARLSAKGKVYRYSLRLGESPDVFRRKYQYRVEETLDIEAMKKAAEMLCGSHDFRSFCSLKRYKKSTLRRVDSIEFVSSGDNLDIIFRGEGFLYNMVRIITGTLIEVGLGQRRAEEMDSVFAALDRSAAGKTAPAQGLCLVKVEY